MKRFLIKWWYKKKFLRAYVTLERLYQRHRDAGHEAYFSAINETNISFHCVNCTELQPLRRKAEDRQVITVASDGRPYRG